MIVRTLGVLNSVLAADVTGDGEEELLVGLYSAKKGLVLKWGAKEEEDQSVAAQ